MDQNRKKIVRLIYLYLMGELTEDSNRELRDWLNESDGNRTLFEELCSAEDFIEIYRRHKQIDHKQAFLSFREQVQDRRGIGSHILKYAAILLLPLSIAVALWLMPEKRSTLYLAQEDVSVVPGGTKAVLRLGNGQSITLSNDSIHIVQSDQSVQIIKNNSEVIYIEEFQALDQNSYNELETPRGGEYRFKLPDGSVVYLNSETTIRYPAIFTGDKREVSLMGEAFFEVTEDRERPFHVVTSDIEIKVYGTSFNVNTYNPRQIQTTLVEGKVGIAVKASGDEIILEPNQMAEYDQESNEVRVKDVYTYSYIAWKSGEFVFDKEPLSLIMKRLNMWYNTEVVFEDSALKEIQFTGIVTRFAEVKDVLSLIEATTSVRFEIKGETIYVME